MSPSREPNSAAGARPGNQRLRWVKMHGCANDYIYLDAFNHPELAERAGLAALARAMSHRHTGIGSDGLILVCRPTAAGAAKGAHARMVMFNSDGSPSGMCGNGVRCVAKFAHDRLGLRASPLAIETGRGVLRIAYEIDDSGPGPAALSSASVNMGAPILAGERVPTSLRPTSSGRVLMATLADELLARAFGPDADASSGSTELARWTVEAGLDARVTCVSMGNPHGVWFCRDVSRVPLERVGAVLEVAEIFPERANVHFVEVRSRTELVMRTWERGAGITQACGTGACAALVAGVLAGVLDRGVVARVPGGTLSLFWDAASDDVYLSGPAEDVCEGTWDVIPTRPES